MANEDIGDEIDKAILAEGSRHVRDDSLIIVDPTEIRKEFGLRMEHVTMVGDASRSSKEGREVLVHGYHGCMAVACQNVKRKTVPFALKLWSSLAPGHLGENDEVLKLVATIMAATRGRGTLAYDRGGDRPAFYRAFIESGVQISFGAMPVRLPMHPEKDLHMAVAKGFGNDPMTLLTSLPVNGSFESMWRVVEGYLAHWRVEETIRLVKQAYGFESIRVLSYRGIRNMASIVLATTYFASVWLGRHVKREVLAEHRSRSRRDSARPRSSRTTRSRTASDAPSRGSGDGAAGSSTRNRNQTKTTCLCSFLDSGTCSRRTSANVGAERIGRREALQIPQSGGESLTARSPFKRRETPISLVITHITPYLSG